MTNDKQREILVELLKETGCEKSCDGFKNIEVCNSCTAYERYAESADHLLANGVIVPPCKVGQTVWGKRGCFISHPTKWENPNSLIPCEVIVIKETKKGKYILLKPLLIETYGMRKANEWFPFSAIGKTVFLSREEAEKALGGVQG